MRKTIVCAFALAGFTTAAHAADLLQDINSMKDPIPDNLTIHGVTVYGTIDVGGAYQSSGAPLSGNYPPGLLYNMTGSKAANKAIWTAAENALEQSKVGVKIEESLGYGWAVIGKLETGFDPLSGELADGPGSLIRNNGKALTNFASGGDSSRAGQAFNGPAYAGVTNATYGTLTIGRQQSLQLDALATYDPMALSYAFSPLGYSGFAAGGGDTQDARWDNSIKYVYQYGPAHVAGMYMNGGSDTGILNDAWGVNAGFTYRGLSIDGVYTKEKGAISASSLSAAQCGVGGLSADATTLGLGCSNSLAGTISDNSMWSIQGKYTFDLGSNSFKDAGPAAKVTIYGGYENITQSNPDSLASIGDTMQGGYAMSAVNNFAFMSDKVTQVTWTGAKYELPSGWSFTGAYYHYDQNSFLASSGVNSAGAVTGCTGHGTGSSSNCAGTLNSVSFMVDYQVNKHFDVYGGVQYSAVDGGLSSGFLSDNQTEVVTGARLKF